MFSNFCPLNDCLMSEKSDSQKKPGLASSQPYSAFFLWQFLEYVIWHCHAENIFSYQTSLVKRLWTQVFLAECGKSWRSMWNFLGTALKILRLLHDGKYKSISFSCQHQNRGIGISFWAGSWPLISPLNVKIETPLLIPGDKIIA